MSDYVNLYPAAIPFADTVPLEGRQPEKVTNTDGIERVSNIHTPQIAFYPPAPGVPHRGAILIIPGGGYGIVASGHEGTDIATLFSSKGYSSAVLRYRMAPYKHPVPLTDARRGLRLLRSHAAADGFPADHVGVLGFSAGAHLAATLSTLPDAPGLVGDETDKLSGLPAFTVLGYPVISLVDNNITHGGSRSNLLGKNPPEELLKLLSPELQVTDKTPRAFLFHAVNDPVKIGNSEAYAAALKAHHVPCEFVRLASGGHGYGLGLKNPDTAIWSPQCLGWLEGLWETPAKPAEKK